MHIAKHIMYSVLCFFLYSALQAQTTIQGKVVDAAHQKPIVGANVLLLEKNTKIILQFAITDTAGSFNISDTSMGRNDSLLVEITALHFQQQVVPVNYFQMHKAFALQPVDAELPPVTVKNRFPFIIQNNDTLTYRIKDFQQKDDRTIGDVIKKLPGMEVNANGKIFYNGKAITNFYIDGDNLLDDRYNVATNNIAADMVEKLQVIEHDEPIKVLQKNKLSNRVSLNVALKDKAKIKPIQQAEIGAGYRNIYDLKFSRLNLSNRNKAIQTFAANNSGNNISTDIVAHNNFSWINDINDVNTYFLLDQNYVTPPLEERRYLLNNGMMLNTNHLWKTKNNIQIRCNGYYWNQQQTQQYTNASAYFLRADTIQYITNQYNVVNTAGQWLNLQWVNNNQKFYASDQLFLSGEQNTIQTQLSINKIASAQLLQQNNFSLTNRLYVIKPMLKKGIIEFTAIQTYRQKPESLQLNPAVQDSIFQVNGSSVYNALQTIKNPSFLSYQTLLYRLTGRHILQSFQLTAAGFWQQLNSAIAIMPYNNMPFVYDSSVNQIHWNQYQFFGSYQVNWIRNRYSVSFSLPFNYQILQFKNSIVYTSDTLNRNLYFNPYAQFTLKVGQEGDVKLSLRNNTQSAQLSDLFPGIIIRNYFTLQNNTIPFGEKQQQSISVQFNNKRSIKILFYHVGIDYSRQENNFIVNTTLLQNFQKVSHLPYVNTIRQFQMNAGISQYIFPIKTTLSLSGSWQNGNWLQLVNDSLNAYQNHSWQVKLTAYKKLKQAWAFDYTCNLNGSTSKGLAALSAYRLSQFSWQQNGSIHCFVLKQTDCTVKAESYFFHNNNSADTHSLFVDFIIQKNVVALKAQLSLAVYNLLNNANFGVYSVNGNMLANSFYALRQRMLLLKVTFGL